jgi:hypothetical protein
MKTRSAVKQKRKEKKSPCRGRFFGATLWNRSHGRIGSGAEGSCLSDGDVLLVDDEDGGETCAPKRTERVVARS